jgi:Bacterial SH3 domain
MFLFLQSVASAHNLVTHPNEWVEGTQIEPSASYGNLYLDLTRQFTAQFKSGAPTVPAAVAPSNPPTPTPTAVPPTLAPDQRRTTDILRVRDGPGLNYDILGRLRADRVVQIVGRSEDDQWLQIAFPDADHLAWISAAYVAPPTELDSFPIEVAPTDTPTPTPAPMNSPDGDWTEYLPDWY